MSSSFILSNDELYELLQVKRPRLDKEKEKEKKEELPSLENFISLENLDFKPFVDIQSMNTRIQRILLDWQTTFQSSISKKIPLLIQTIQGKTRVSAPKAV